MQSLSKLDRERLIADAIDSAPNTVPGTLSLYIAGGVNQATLSADHARAWRVMTSESLGKEMTLYRGMRIDRPAQSYKVGETYTIGGPRKFQVSSWSTGKDVASEFAGTSRHRRVILKMRTSTGADVRKISWFPEQKEVIKGGRFRVVKKETQNVQAYTGSHRKIPATVFTVEEVK